MPSLNIGSKLSTHAHTLGHYAHKLFHFLICLLLLTSNSQF